MRFLRTNTAVRVTVGPFMDKADGVTPETSLTVTNCKLTLMVDDANVPTLVLDASATASGGNNDMVHVTNDDAGFYDLELTAANLNYLGRAVLAITDAANHCPVFHEFMILPAMIYDSLVLGTDRLDTNVTHIGDQSQTAKDLGAINVTNLNTLSGHDPGATLGTSTLTQTQVTGGAYSVQSSSCVLGDARVANLDATISSRAAAALFTGITSVAEWLGLIAGKQTGNSTARTEIRATGAGSGSFDETTDSLQALRDRGDAAWITATGFSTHSASDVWAVATRVLTAGTNLPTAAGIADAVWEEAISDHSSTSGSTAEALNAAGSAGDPWTTALPGSYTSGQAGYIIGNSAIQTGDSYAIVNSGTHGNAAIKGYVDDIGVAGAGLTAIPGLFPVVTGTVGASPSPSSTVFASSVTGAGDDQYNDQTMVFTSGALAGQSRVITDYTSSTGAFTFDEAWTTAPTASDAFKIIGTHTHTRYQIASTIWTNATRTLTATGLSAITAWTVDITGSLSGSVGTVNALANNVITTSSIASGAYTAAKFNADVTTAFQSGLATASSISALNDLSAAEVNAEVVDALNVDTYAEIGQEAPAATQTIRKMLAYLYKAFRNKKVQTSTTFSLYADDGTTVDQKSTESDDGSTYTQGELGSGP